ncbi:MAG TPA: hypothetical protein VKB88_01605 [Bryobacteraceae bacterium]|nr:hypothetical protein [Bryobacteraceae bacterium]
MNRRRFLEHAGLAVGASAAQNLMGATQSVAIVVDPRDRIASSTAASWAVQSLQSAFSAAGVSSNVVPGIQAVKSGDWRIIVSGADSDVARQILRSARVSMQPGPEKLSLATGNAGGNSALLAAGTDERGLTYAVLELADRVRFGSSLDIKSPIVEEPANTVRSCARCFVSDIEDKAWFYDRSMWTEYLTMLATHRFNRFNLTLGIGYNSARDIPDSYFYFAYPFLLPVPGYNVTAVGLPDAERDRNFEMLKFISEQTVLRGLQFNLALWSHAYEWPNSDTNYKISGLTPATHPAYCRDGLAAVLKACPGITGLSFRVHTESGIPDGRYDFWETLFEAIKNSGRKIDLDIHAKGTDEHHIAIARATGMPVSMAPKFWAEHLGMPYHQASIREQEFQPRTGGRRGAVPSGNSITAARNFLRYGYGDYLKDTRQYGIIHRVWPGTQRHLLWGDPAMAAGYGRAFSFSGSLGVELFEPLSFKGRMGSGIAGGRLAYADKSLEPKWDWQKYDYQYRVWGRYTYNPDTDADGHRRYLREQFKAASQPLEAALSSASRVLPVITTTHGASGSNNSYWPEMYMNMPIVDAARAQPYSDTPDPKVFGNVSAFDPQLFSTANECAAALLEGQEAAKYNPLDVAQWLDDMSAAASKNQAQAIAASPRKDAPELRRVITDIDIQAGIGKFFAYKFRSAVLWELYQQTGDKTALNEAFKAYRTARRAWASLSETAKKAYATDITYGKNANMRGHWADRITGIDGDLADMEARLNGSNAVTPAKAVDPAIVKKAVATVLAPPNRISLNTHHTPAAHFEPGKPLEVSVAFNSNGPARKVNLMYRQADQSQRWHSVAMQAHDNEFRATIPADYTQSPYPLQYYFEVHTPGGSTIFPGFSPDLSNQPYILVRSERGRG